MITFALDTTVLGRTRFAFSPLAEAALSVRLLAQPHPTHLHAAWIRWARPMLRDVDLSLILAALPQGRWIADSLMPTLGSPATTIDIQLHELSRRDPQALLDELRLSWEGHPAPTALRGCGTDHAGLPSLLADAMWDYWEAVIAPHWPRMCAVLEDDVAHRTATLAAEGLFAMLGGLHSEISIEDEAIRVNKPHHDSATFTAYGMTLTPSIFGWPGLVLGEGGHGQFCLTYGARGIGRAWAGIEDEPLDGDGLGLLLGRTRAQILTLAAIPMTTTHIARRLGQSPGSVSQHLSVLRGSGLVTSWRSGRSVLYRQTATGQAVVEAQSRTPHRTPGSA